MPEQEYRILVSILTQDPDYHATWYIDTLTVTGGGVAIVYNKLTGNKNLGSNSVS